MKISIAKSRCAGHARCNVVAPDIFLLDDDGYIAIESVTVSKENEALARRAVRACPEGIITIIDES
jgi:ferredoxin